MYLVESISQHHYKHIFLNIQRKCHSTKYAYLIQHALLHFYYNVVPINRCFRDTLILIKKIGSDRTGIRLHEYRGGIHDLTLSLQVSCTGVRTITV